MPKSYTLFLLFLLLMGCNQVKHEVSRNAELKATLARDCKRAQVLYYVNFATSKISILAKDVRNKNSIDSIISYIGEEKKDSLCYLFSDNTPVGEIYFYKDTSMVSELANMDFILEGKCSGFYQGVERTSPKFDITTFGKLKLEGLKKIK